MALGFRMPGNFLDPTIALGTPPYSRASGADRNVWNKIRTTSLETGSTGIYARRWHAFGEWAGFFSYGNPSSQENRRHFVPMWFPIACTLHDFSVRKIAATPGANDLAVAIYANQSDDVLSPAERLWSGRIQWRATDPDVAAAGRRAVVGDDGDSLAVTAGTVLWAAFQRSVSPNTAIMGLKSVSMPGWLEQESQAWGSAKFNGGGGIVGTYGHTNGPAQAFWPELVYEYPLPATAALPTYQDDIFSRLTIGAVVPALLFRVRA